MMMLPSGRRLSVVTAAVASLITTIHAQTTIINPPGPRPWINEFHYDNFGTDVDEFIEVAAPEGLNVANWSVVLYDGFFGYLYEEDAFHPLPSFELGETINGVTFYVKHLPPQNCSEASAWCGLENGKDGFALAEFFSPTTGRVTEFWSYEGTFRAKEGPAFNLTSTDVGVFQLANTPRGHSVSKVGVGCDPDDFFWALSSNSTPGSMNFDQTVTCEVAFINEFHYDNENNGEGQFVEIAMKVDDIADYSLVLYNGQDGLPYDSILLTSFTEGETTEDGLTFYYYDFPLIGGQTGLEVNRAVVSKQDGSVMEGEAAGFALVRDDSVVIEFLSYGGKPFVAQGGVAEGMLSMDVGVSEDDTTPVGSSLQLVGGPGCAATEFMWEAITANQVDLNPMGATKGAFNIGQDIVCFEEPPVMLNVTDSDEEEEDDLILEDDDFLDRDTMVIMRAPKNRAPVYYEEGERATKPIFDFKGGRRLKGGRRRRN